MKIKCNDLSRQFYMFQEEYEKKAIEILRSGWYVLGKEVENFEKEFAESLHSKYCVGLASGLDALALSIRILGIGEGDEVIVPANTYIATVMGISMNNASPVFVEPDEFYNIDPEKIEEAITSKTKAVLSVNLYGQACDMVKLRSICDKHSLYLIEDCAQSHGASYDNLFTNQYADISCFSFYPSKNLGGFGDGGAITTDHAEWANLFKIYRNYGSEKRYHNMVVGVNSRLDEMQAGLLRIKLRHLSKLNAEREKIAKRYQSEIINPAIVLPRIRDKSSSVWHLFVVLCDERDALQNYLQEHGIACLIHYPIPPHRSQAYAYLGYKENSFPVTESYAQKILTLPLYNGMTEAEQNYVIDIINQFNI